MPWMKTSLNVIAAIAIVVVFVGVAGHQRRINSTPFPTDSAISEELAEFAGIGFGLEGLSIRLSRKYRVHASAYVFVSPESVALPNDAELARKGWRKSAAVGRSGSIVYCKSPFAGEVSKIPSTGQMIVSIDWPGCKEGQSK